MKKAKKIILSLLMIGMGLIILIGSNFITLHKPHER